MRKLLLAATALAALSFTPAKADIIHIGGLDWNTAGATLLTLGASPGGGQTTNIPCVICGANQPNQTNAALNFGYTDFGNTGNQTNLAFFSSGTFRDHLAADTIAPTNYSGAQLIGLLQALGDPALTFSIGVDMNDTGAKHPQTLESFFFLDLTAHTILAAFSPGLNDGVVLPSINNGTGHPDYTLNGLTGVGLVADHQYAFFSRISNANDGPDSFFLIAQPSVAAVPEISTWAMLIIGFAGVAGIGGLRGKFKDFRVA